MYLASGGDAIRLYDTEQYHFTQKYKPLAYSKKNTARDIGWSHNGKFFGIVIDGEPTIEITNVGETMKPFENFEVREPSAITFPKHSSSTVAVGTKCGVVHTVKYLNRKDIISFPSCNARITSMDYSFNDTSVAAGTVDGRIIICGIQSRQIIREFNLPTPEVISSVKFHYSRKGILAVGSHNGHVTVWDTNFNGIDCKFSDHTAQCMAVVFSPLNKHFMASVGFDYLVFCYDMRAKRQVLKASIPAAGSSLDVHKNGNTLAVATVSGTICIFDLRNTRAPIKQLITKGCTVKVMYQLEPEEPRKSSAGTATSLERLVHRRNSTEALKKSPFTTVSKSCVSATEESQSSDDSHASDDVFSPLGEKSPSKLSKDLSLFSSLSASKILDTKRHSFLSSKKQSPGGYSLTCNNSEEFDTGLRKTLPEIRNGAPYLHLGSITETAGEETKFLKSVEDFAVSKSPHVAMQNGNAQLEYHEVLTSSRVVVQNSHEKVQDYDVFATPKTIGKSSQSLYEKIASSTFPPIEEYQDELSEVNTSSLLNKYSLTKGLGKECDISITLNSDDFSGREIGAVAIVPQEVLPTSVEVEGEEEKVEPFTKQLEGIRDEACAIPQVPDECKFSLKEQLDAKFLEHSDEVYTNLSKMHLFNIHMHTKHERMLERILKIVEEQTLIEKKDKCVGTM